MFSVLYAGWSLVHIFTEYLKLPIYGFLPWKQIWLSVQLQRSNSMIVNMQLFVGCLPCVTTQKVTHWYNRLTGTFSRAACKCACKCAVNVNVRISLRFSTLNDFNQDLSVSYIFLIKYPDSPDWGSSDNKWVNLPYSAFVLVNPITSKKNMSLIQLISTNKEYNPLVLGGSGDNAIWKMLIGKLS